MLSVGVPGLPGARSLVRDLLLNPLSARAPVPPEAGHQQNAFGWGLPSVARCPSHDPHQCRSLLTLLSKAPSSSKAQPVQKQVGGRVLFSSSSSSISSSDSRSSRNSQSRRLCLVTYQERAVRLAPVVTSNPATAASTGTISTGGAVERKRVMRLGSMSLADRLARRGADRRALPPLFRHPHAPWMLYFGFFARRGWNGFGGEGSQRMADVQRGQRPQLVVEGRPMCG